MAYSEAMLGEEPSPDVKVDLVRRLFDAFSARDEDKLLELVSTEIEFFGPSATVLHEGRCYRGHEGMRRYLSDAERLWDRLDLDPQRLHEVGSHVVVLGRVLARAHDGLELDIPAAWVWRVENGAITWGCAYGDPDQMPRSLQEGGRGPASVDAARLRAPRRTAAKPEPLS